MNELAGVFRWWLCLRIAGVPLSFLRAAALHFLGLFTSLFLPGTAGGDAAKIAAVMFWYPPRKIAGVLAVLMERLSGLVVVMLWTTLVAALRAGWFQRTPATAALFHAVLFFLGTVGLGMVFWYLASRPGRVRRHPRWLPLRARMLEIAGIFDLFPRRPQAGPRRAAPRRRLPRWERRALLLRRARAGHGLAAR